MDIKSTELKQRAVRIAEVLSENAGWLEKRGGIANTRFISYINNITMEDVWVVNSDRELKLPQRMNTIWHAPADDARRYAGSGAAAEGVSAPQRYF